MNHFVSRDAAQESLPREREVAQKALRAWQIIVPLSSKLPSLDFELEREVVIGPNNNEVFGTGYRSSSMRVALAMSIPECPPPPDEFVVSWEVDAMWAHYERYLHGGEPLLAMAYFCLTVLEWSAAFPVAALNKKLAAAAHLFRIDVAVLTDVSKLTSTLGGVGSARKLDRRASRLRELSASEREFLEAAIRAMIRRVGEHAFDPARSWPQITKLDLPGIDA